MSQNDEGAVSMQVAVATPVGIDEIIVRTVESPNVDELGRIIQKAVSGTNPEAALVALARILGS